MTGKEIIEKYEIAQFDHIDEHGNYERVILACTARVLLRETYNLALSEVLQKIPEEKKESIRGMDNFPSLSNTDYGFNFCRAEVIKIVEGMKK